MAYSSRSAAGLQGFQANRQGVTPCSAKHFLKPRLFEINAPLIRCALGFPSRLTMGADIFETLFETATARV